jgi:hypothetical protein
VHEPRRKLERRHPSFADGSLFNCPADDLARASLTSVRRDSTRLKRLSGTVNAHAGRNESDFVALDVRVFRQVRCLGLLLSRSVRARLAGTSQNAGMVRTASETTTAHLEPDYVTAELPETAA